MAAEIAKSKRVVKSHKSTNIEVDSDETPESIPDLLTAVGDDYFKSLVSHLVDLLQVDFVFVGEFSDDNEAVTIIASSAKQGIYAGMSCALDGTPHRHVAINKRLVAYSDKVIEFFPKDRLLEDLAIKGYMAYPLLGTYGQPLGLLGVLDRKPLKKIEWKKSVLSTFCPRAAQEMERKHAGEELLLISEEIDLFSSSLKELYRIKSTYHSSIEGLFTDYLKTGCKLFELPMGIVWQIQNQWCHIQAVHSDLDFLKPGMKFKLEDTLCRIVLEQNRTINYSQNDRIELQRFSVSDQWQLTTYIGAPIHVNDNIYGVLNFTSNQEGTHLREHHLEIIDLMAQGLGREIERRQVEDALRGSERALRESEARKGAIMQSALDCIITIDHQGKIIEFNPAAEKTFGYTRAQVLDKDLSETIIPPSFREAHRRGLAHYLATGEGPVLGKRIEISGMRADGSEFPVELAIVSIRLGENPIFTAYLRDITEPKRAEKELRQAKETAEAANHMKGELLAQLKERHHELEETLNQLEVIRSELEAENARKARELEEARRLQLAMLPKNIPKLRNLDIAVYMETATEVGGDYYDFHVDSNGALTVAIGDATGHGLQAGTIVASTKSLFKALAHEPEPSRILKKMSTALKSMGFRKMFMAMIVAKLSHNQMTLSSAGMPFTLLNRAETGKTQEVVLKAVPLGSFPEFRYRQKTLRLKPGDAILFVSDGLHEIFNAQEEMLGEARVRKLFTEIAGSEPGHIVEHLVNSAKSWADGQAQRDDITILAIKMK